MTTPYYDPNVPENQSDPLATSQPDLVSNFASLYDIWSRNHVPLDSVTGSGNHTIVELIEQDHDLQTGISQISLYSKDVEGQTNQVFVRTQGNTQVYQLTNYQIYSIPSTNQGTRFFTFLPGKVLVYFGRLDSDQGSTRTMNLELNPKISKNIITITATCTPSNTGTAIAKPTVTFQKTTDGIYSFAVFNNTFRMNSLYYLIMANL